MDAFLAQAASSLRSRLDLGEREEKIFLFSLRVLWTTVLSFAAVIISAAALGLLRETLWAFLAGGSLRTVSGGAHSETPGRCAIIGAVAYLSMGILARGLAAEPAWEVFLWFSAALWIGAILAVYRHAPAGTHQKPIIDPTRIRRLKRISLAVLAGWALFTWFSLTQPSGEGRMIYAAVSLGLAWQASTITPAGYRLGRILDNFVERLVKGSV